MKPSHCAPLGTLRRSSTHAALFLMLLGVSHWVSGCRPSTPESAKPPSSDDVGPASAKDSVRAPRLGTSPTVQDSATANPRAVSAATPKTSAAASGARTTAPPVIARKRSAPYHGETLTVAAFLSRTFEADDQVVVTGSCLDQFLVRGSAGPPPFSRSDWQLASDGLEVYVVGIIPGECSSGPVTITARVGVDTVQATGHPQPRRFLIIARKP
jgi:hypothetical protein